MPNYKFKMSGKRSVWFKKKIIKELLAGPPWTMTHIRQENGMDTSFGFGLLTDKTQSLHCEL